MSADNWATCPRCQAKAEADSEARIEQAQLAYGNVSIEEFDQLRAEAEKGSGIDTTLREDYEFHLDTDGTFTARYRGRCEPCGFEYAFNHTEQVPLTAPEPSAPA